MEEYKIFTSVIDLPAEWDEMAGIYFRQKEFLLHAEKYNFCKQRYYVLYSNEKFRAGAVLYTLPLDLLTFLHIKSPVKMHICGIPCSVSCSGIFGTDENLSKLKKHIYKKEKGLVLFLNLESITKEKNVSTGATLPTIVLKNKFGSWDMYVSSLRSDYRRRLNYILTDNDDIKLERIKCNEYTEEMYGLYLQVFNKSKAKLEKLNFDFFRNLPDSFSITLCKKKNDLLGWNITLFHNNAYYFFLGGVDYNQNKDNAVYLKLLFNIVQEGIEKKADFIDLGQTAEIPKLRTGGMLEPRYMEAIHSNAVFNSILKIAKGTLSYKRKVSNHNVFKTVVQ